MAYWKYQKSVENKDIFQENAQLTGGNTGKNEKEYSWHVPAIKFTGMKQLVSKVVKILEKLRYLWKCEIWGNIVKIWYFVNNCLIKARI